jgi:23S rRNA (pseudouridine1915-N3)-methyltransferase
MSNCKERRPRRSEYVIIYKTKEKRTKMNINIIAMGKIKEKYIQEGIKEFSKRLSRYCKLNIIELEDEKAPETLSEKDMIIVKAKEGERILNKIPSNSFVIALVIHGKQLTSETLAEKIEEIMVNGQNDITFIIGGSLGLSPEVISRSDFKLSFSKMTFPHQLMRLILLEQIYRAWRINKGEPYHK